MQVVSHNLDAMNAERNLQINTNQKSKASEKLASGYKINKAADDAAGLSITEKMRYQIRGLNRGTNNTEEGISLIQTAEGAANEIHTILQRMNELAVQAANDTNTSEERTALNDEAQELKNEIGRISKTTEFNDRTVLRARQVVEIEAEDYSNITMKDKVHISTINQDRWGKVIDFSNVNESTKKDLIGMDFYVTCSENCSQRFAFNFTDATSSKATLSGSGSRGDLTLEIGVNDATIKNGADVTQKIIDLVTTNQGALGGGGAELKIGHANGISADGAKLTMYASSKSIAAGPPTYSSGMGKIHAAKLLNMEEGIKFQVSFKPFQEIEYKIKTINAGTLGIGDVDLTTHNGASEAITSIHDAIDNLSNYRSYMGAMQNRLEHVTAINRNSEENTQAAESQLRDTDMAEEMKNLSISKILEQVGEAMLSHAKARSEGVLQLLG